MKFPTDPQKKRQLWAEIQAKRPEVVTMMNTYKDLFGTCTLTKVEIDGVLYEQQEEDPDKVFTITEDWVKRHTTQELTEQQLWQQEQNKRLTTKARAKRKK